MLITPNFSTQKINKALKENRYVEFKTGVYELTKPLIVYSNTDIVCQPGVVFKRWHKGRMMQLYVTPDTTKYKGTHDVTWTGGTFVADTNSANANTANAIVLGTAAVSSVIPFGLNPEPIKNASSTKPPIINPW